MKNLFKFSFFVVALFVMAGCGDDDPKPISIVGKWTMESVKPGIEVNGKPLKEFLMSGGATEAEAQAQVEEFENQFPSEEFEGIIGDIEFKSDGTFTGTAEDDNGDAETVSGTYKITDNKNITITDSSDPNEPLTGKIDSVTSMNLQISTFLGSDESSGFKMDFYLVLYFKKI